MRRHLDRSDVVLADLAQRGWKPLGSKQSQSDRVLAARRQIRSSGGKGRGRSHVQEKTAASFTDARSAVTGQPAPRVVVGRTSAPIRQLRLEPEQTHNPTECRIEPPPSEPRRKRPPDRRPRGHHCRRLMPARLEARCEMDCGRRRQRSVTGGRSLFGQLVWPMITRARGEQLD